MKRAIILIHGFKSRNNDDFSDREMIKYFESIGGEIFNLNWFDNYDLSTQNFKYVENFCYDISKKVNSFEEIMIIGYSTGALLAEIIKKNISDKSKVKIWLVGPLIKRYSLIRGLGAYKTERKESKRLKNLRKNLTQKEYIEEVEKMKETKSFDMYIFRNYIYTEKLKLKYRKLALKDPNIHWLLAKNDFAIKTPEVYKILKRKNRDVTLKDFNHGLIFNLQKQIFINWFEGYR